MISVRITDKRYGAGFRSMLFEGNEATRELYDFVKHNKKVQSLLGYGWFYKREDFLSKYSYLEK